MYIVAMGSDFNGWDFYGPFEYYSDADEFVYGNENWQIIQLLEP